VTIGILSKMTRDIEIVEDGTEDEIAVRRVTRVSSCRERSGTFAFLANVLHP